MPELRATDYEQIANRYDAERGAWQVEVEDLLRPPQHLGRTARLIDVGCGTGSYLLRQAVAFGERLDSTGVDPSAGMLAAATAKLGGLAGLIRSRAESLPIATGTFDVVHCGFAYHHFTEKPRALRELVRVCAPGGSVKVRNVDPWSMDDWWIYRFFPPVRALDEQRFWRPGRIASHLQDAGASVRVDLQRDVLTESPSMLLERARLRVASQLAILDDTDYRAGLQRLAAYAGANDSLAHAQATVTIVATKAAGRS